MLTERSIKQAGDRQRGSMPVPDIQREMPFLGEVRKPTMAPEALVKACRNRLDAIILCIQLSRKSQGAVAKALGLDKGHLTRILSGLAYFPDQKSVELMHFCGNYAPMQFEVMATGHQIYSDPRAKREAELEAELIAIRQQRIEAAA